jgi:malate dehydrogenase (oxaloacetate-decarboxylating)
MLRCPRSVTRTHAVRDVSVTVSSEAVGDAVCAAVERLPELRIINVSDATFLAHLGGKIRIEGKIPVKTRADLSIVYTPRRHAGLDGDCR